jgi:lysophospholipase L1-like esterase
MNGPTPQRSGLARRLLFAAVVSSGLLGLTELGLRLAGVEAHADRRVSWCREHIVPSPPFFPTAEVDGLAYRVARTESQPHPWPALKRPGTRRILALGGSAVHGYGFTRAYAWPDRLEEHLAGAWGGVPVEVLNLGTVAWSSQQLLELTKHALVELEPDAIVVMSGNNELLEWLGARRYLPPEELRAWVTGVTWSRRLRSLALYNALADKVEASSGAWGQTEISDDDSLPVEDQGLLTEADRAFAERNFRHDLGRIRELSEDHGVPLVVVAPPVNLEYAPPEWPGTDNAASRAYARAQELHEQGEPASAVELYWQALEQDPSPNRVLPRVRQAALDQDATATLDGHAVLEATTLDGVVGWSEVFDHCHPNEGSHEVLAQAIAEVLVEQVFPGGQVQQPPPLTGLDAWSGRQGGDYLRDPETEKRRMLEAARAAAVDAPSQLHLGAVVWHTVNGLCPEGRGPCVDEALSALRAASRADPGSCEAWAGLGRIGFAIDHPETRGWLDQALACDPQDARSAWYRQRLSRRSPP